MSTGEPTKILRIGIWDSIFTTEIATFAAGCFWGVEHIFLKHFSPSQNKGILSTRVGYTGGDALVTNPTYEHVYRGTTNHAEAVRIEFDPSKVAYVQLVGMYANIVSRLVYRQSQNFSIALTIPQC